jgi:PST family polysaccharide transporter
MLPTSVVAAILAHELVFCILGLAWSEVVLPFRILAAGLVLRTSYKMSDSLSRATGAVYRRSWRQAVYAILVLGGSWIGQFWGVAGVAAGVLGALIANYLLMAQMSLKLVESSWQTFFAAQRKSVLLSAAVATPVILTVAFLREVGGPPLLVLFAASAIGLTTLFVIVRFASRSFLGAEGEWMLELLFSYVPERLKPRLAFLRAVGSPTANAAVAENPGS